MAEQENKTNWGCMIIVAIFVIVSLIQLFSSSKENISEMGGSILGFAFIAGIFYLISKFGSSENDSKKQEVTYTKKIDTKNEVYDSPRTDTKKESSKSSGAAIKWILGIVVVIALFAIMGSILNDFDITYIAGAIFAIIFVLIFGIILYNAGKDE